ncbi:DUF1015 domain-containing protein [bacterium]|nr:MAG: DUF1015 domain-containing protein [bacterium]
MAVLHPFKAWRPTQETIYEIACVPYDVIDTDEARALADGKPNSFLHVIRPEIDLNPEIDIHADEVYEQGSINLQKVLSSGLMTQEEKASLYIYRLIMDGREQTGIFSCVSVADYDKNVILKHELTRPDKEDDRTRHILTQSAHAEPVMLTYKDHGKVNTIVHEVMKTKPMFDFKADDGVSHTLWRVSSTEELVGFFDEIPSLYVADGHHRCKSASRVAEEIESKKIQKDSNEYQFFPAVLFPMSMMKILAYNRVVKGIESDFVFKLESTCKKADYISATPKEAGHFSVFYSGAWNTYILPATNGFAVADKLDVSRLSEYILQPILGIQDQRTDKRIHFVGGIRGTVELEKLVNTGKADIAFSMFPTSIQELMDVSDAGELMPPKSTWFEPKLRSGLLVHTF